MFIGRQKIRPAALAGAAAVALIVSISAPGFGQEGIKLEGAWIARFPGQPGVQFTYALSPDPSGRRATITAFIQVGVMPSLFGLFPDAEILSPVVGEAAMTADGTVIFNSVLYGIKKGWPFDQIVFIEMDYGQVRYTGTGKAEGTQIFALYDPISDQDGDGLPDPGAIPVLTSPPMTRVDTRVPLPR